MHHRMGHWLHSRSRAMTVRVCREEFATSVCCPAYPTATNASIAFNFINSDYKHRQHHRNSQQLLNQSSSYDGISE